MLEGKLAEIMEWNREAEHYHLKEIGDGLLVYASKDGENAMGPPHYICPTCYANRKRSILQKLRQTYQTSLNCHVCKAEFPLE